MVQKRTITLWMCCLAHAVQDGLSAGIYVLLPVLAHTLGLNLGEVGLFKGLKNLAQGLLEIVSGIASERFGDKVLLVFGLAASGIGYLLFSFAGGAATVLVCLIVVGVGTAFQHAPSSALVSRAYADSGRRGALGLYNSSGDAGKLVFTTSFSLAIGAGLAWSWPTMAFGLAAVLSAAVVFFALEGRRQAAALAGQECPESLGAEAVATKWGIQDRQGFSSLLTVVALDSMVQAAVLTFTAFLMLEKGVPLYIATFAATAILIGGMFGKALCGFLADRIGVRTAFSIVQLLTATLIVLAVLVPGGWAFGVLPVLGIVLQGSTSITYSMVNDFVHPARISRGFALIYASSSFASVAGPLSLGLIGDRWGVETGMVVMAAVALLAIPPCLYLRLGHVAAAPVAKSVS